MYGYYQKDTTFDVDGLKYKLVKYYDDDIGISSTESGT